MTTKTFRLTDELAKGRLRLNVAVDNTNASINAAFVEKYDEYLLKAKTSNPFADYIDLTPTDRQLNLMTYHENIPGLRVWVGEKQVLDLSKKAFPVSTLPYERSIGLKKWDAKFAPNVDKTAQILGKVAAEHKRTLCVSALQTNAVHGFDNKAFFATDHDLNPLGNQSNVWTGVALATVTDAANAISGALGRGAAFTNNVNEIIGVDFDTIFVPPNKYQIFNDAVEGVFLQGTTAYKGNIKVIKVPELSSAPNDVFFHDSKVCPAFTMFELEPLGMQYQGEGSHSAFYNGDYIWSLEGNFVVIPTLWYSMLRVTGT